MFKCYGKYWLFFLSRQSGRFRLLSSNSLPLDCSFKIKLFSKTLPCSSDLFRMYTFQALVWDLGSDLSLFLRAFDLIFRIRSKQGLLLRGELRNLHTTFWSYFTSQSLWYFKFPWALLFDPGHCKLTLLFVLYTFYTCTHVQGKVVYACVLPHSLGFLLCSRQEGVTV